MKNIIFVAGGKGGVGKSIVTMALLNYLRQQGDNVMLVDSDTSNPDTWRTYQDIIEARLIDLDHADGWITLVDECDTHRDTTLVVNTASRNNEGVKRYGNILHSVLPELNRKLITLWTINRQRDSLELLKDHIAVFPDSTTHVLRNAYFGDEDKFELYNKSKIRQTIESQGGKSLTFPDLADRVADDLYSKRMSIETALAEMPIGNRAELMRWISETNKVFREVTHA